MKKVTFQILSDKLRVLNDWAALYDERYIIVIDERYMYLYNNTNNVVFKSSIPKKVFLVMCAIISRYQRLLSSELKLNREHC